MIRLFGSAFLCFTCSIAFPQEIEVKMSGAVKQLENDTQFKHATLSLYVIDTKTGKVVFDKNSQVGLAPASCMKIVTSAAAFELLGKDYRYQTGFGYDGIIEGNTLQGNLILKTSGDPSLGSWRWKATAMDSVLQKMLIFLKAKNIKTITGNIIVDDSKWSTQATPRGWTWDDMGNYYGAGARAFNWNENQYDLNLKTGKKVGDPVEITGTEPSMPVPLINELTTARTGSGDNSVIYLPEDGTIGYVRGTIGTEISKVSGSIPNPLNVFIDQLKKYLQTNGISFNGKFKKEVIPATIKTQLNFSSPSLDSINYWFLQKSVNLFGEAFVKTIAYEKTGFGSTDTGINIIRDFWAKNGIERSALHNIDGSGLSPANRVTTNALVTIMQYAQKQNWFPSFYNALPVQNGIKMKSGYIGGVRSYTGYIKSRSGAEYTFSFIINNYDGNPGAVREKMWKLLDVLK